MTRPFESGQQTSSENANIGRVLTHDQLEHDRAEVDVTGSQMEFWPSTPAQAATPPALQPTAAPHSLKRRLVLADTAAITAGMTLAFLFQELVRPVPLHVQIPQALLMLASIPLILFALFAMKTFNARVVERREEESKRIFASTAIGVLVMPAIAFGLQYNLLSRLWIVSVLTFVTTMLLVERRISREVFASLRRQGRIRRRIAILGTDGHAIGLMHTLERNPELGYQVVGFIGDDDIGERGGCGVLGRLDQAEDILRGLGCVGVMVSLASVDPAHVNRLTRRLTDTGFHVALSSSLHDIDASRMRTQVIDGRTMIYVEPVIRDGWRGHAKRVFDLGIALFGLLLAIPVIAVSAVLIKLTSRGPVLFSQTRVGLDGEQFKIHKFRTMFNGAEARRDELLELNESDGPLFKINDDPRITSVGRMLRKLSIDEIPQLWNVVRGEMSVVGPRPALPTEVAEWDDEVHERLRVLPGITGMWQVSGRADTSFDEYKRLDMYYVDNWSLLHDLRIVLKTFTVVIAGRGAS